jgi:hypothetical protein
LTLLTFPDNLTQVAQNSRQGQKMIWKYTLAWIPMIFIAIANGAIRQFVYGQWVSELAAHQISSATAIVLFFFYTLFLSGRWPFTKANQAWVVGLIWLCLTIAFEFAFGHFVAGQPIDRLAQDYNVAAGRLWPFILAALFLMPYVTFRIRRRS